ncbi:MAG: hypothetical protein ABFC54_02075 [Thermoguttaceae bacterium]
MKKALSLSLLAVGILLGGLGFWAFAAGPTDKPSKIAVPTPQRKPIAIVSVSSYDKLLDNLAVIGQATGSNTLSSQLIMGLKVMAIQQGLEGVSRQRPCGLILQADGDRLTGYAFLPIGDAEGLAKAAASQFGEPENLGDGIYKVKGVAPIYVAPRDGWVFLACRRDALDSLPDNPIELLQGLNTQYDGAVRIFANHLLPKQREAAVAWMKERLASIAQPMTYEPECVFSIRKQATASVLQPVLDGFHDVETITAGWALDTKARNAYVDLNVTVAEDSPTAKTLIDTVDDKNNKSKKLSQKTSLPAEWSVSIGSAAQSMAAKAPTQAVRSAAAAVAIALAPETGRDHVKLSAKPIPHGVACRLEAERSVIELLGRLRAPVAKDADNDKADDTNAEAGKKVDGAK